MESGYDVRNLCQEAQYRWLKPLEVQFILQNYEKIGITQKSPNKPPSGSLFIFNKRVLRFFRKDGHVWRKKRDGRAVGEAHERLKIGNNDALNCYYAHGELNPLFQRRCYWMLDPVHEHIVLVHYLEVEGRPISGSTVLTDSSLTFNQTSNHAPNQDSSPGYSIYKPCQNSSSPVSVEEVNSDYFIGNKMFNYIDLEDRSVLSVTSSQEEVHQAIRKLTVQLSLDDQEEEDLDQLPYFGQESYDLGSFDNENVEFPHDRWVNLSNALEDREEINGFNCNDGKQNNSSFTMLLQHSGDTQKDPSLWNNRLAEFSNRIDTYEETAEKFLLGSDAVSAARNTDIFVKGLPSEFVDDRQLTSTGKECLSTHPNNHLENSTQQHRTKFQHQLSETRKYLLGPDEFELFEECMQHKHFTSANESSSQEGILPEQLTTEWMGVMNTSINDNLFSSDCSGMLFDQTQYISLIDTNSTALTHTLLFSIREVTPEWTFSSQCSKVVIMGDFLCDPSKYSWAVMFGDIEVPLETIQEGILCCQAPQHAPGRVTFCITSGSRQPCSVVREFEYFTKPETSNNRSNHLAVDGTKTIEENLLLLRFVRTLLCKPDNEVVQTENNIELETNNLSRLPKERDDEWQEIIKSLLDGSMNLSDVTSWLLQELLKDKLQSWLLLRQQKSKETDGFLSMQDHCIIHTLSALGFDWALNPILSCGIGINFRDARGWTALHWAACFGREKMVAALLAAGASAGAVTDPTADDPVGKTAASIAALSGHKGLAGYLSEVAITNHLSSLTVEESESSKASATVNAEKAAGSISNSTVQLDSCAIEDQLSLKNSLDAVRNVALAAARIQSAFRAHSFRKRQQKAATSCDEYGMSPEEILEISGASRYQRGSHSASDQKLNVAALCIQKKFRGWKGRRKFLTLRQHIVRIQAHVRGHQVRKKYRLLWTVGVVEKAILRWRRKGVGLRGFRAEESIDEIEEDDILKIFRKKKVDAALDEAVSRVLSMVESPGARQQYSRMLERYRLAKAEQCTDSESASNFNEVLLNGDEDMYQLPLEDSWAALASSDFGQL